MPQWQDDPVVGGWESDPVVDAPKSKTEGAMRRLGLATVRFGLAGLRPGAAATGLGETALQVATGAVAAPVAGYAGIGASLIPGGRDPADVTRSVQEAMTYSPRTQAGQAVSGLVSAPFQALESVADALGNQAGVNNGPLGATAVKTALLAAPMALGLRRPGVQQRSPAVQTLTDANVPLTTAQRGGPVSQAVAGSAGRAADTILGQSGFGANQLQAFNRAMWETYKKDAPPSVSSQIASAVEGATAATPDVMGRVRTVIGDSYDDLHSRVPTRVDQSLSQELNRIASTAQREMETQAFAPILRQIQEINSKTVNGAIEGGASQNIRSSLLRMESGQNGYWAGEIRRALDDAFERGATPEDAAQMRWTRERFRMMRQIENAVANNPDGIVTPARLFNVFGQRMNRNQSIYGAGQQALVDLARAGKSVIRDIPNSGTPQRLMDAGRVAAMVTNPLLAAKFGGGALVARMINENQFLAGILANQTTRMNPAAPAVVAQETD